MEVLTHSKRQAFQNCPRYFMHKHVEHLDTRIQRGGRRRGTIFGSVIAAVADTHKMSPELHFDTDEQGRDEFIQMAVEHDYDELRETGNLDGEALAALDSEEVKVYVMVQEYIKRYGIDPRREMEFLLPLVNPATGRSSRAFRIGGKIDGLSKTWERPDGTKVAVIIEDKFVQAIQRAMIMRLPLDAQSTEYVDAFLSKGWDCMIIYRHTRFSKMEPKPAREYKTKDDYPGETLPEFADRLREAIDLEPTSFFDQQELYFPKDHLADYRAGRWGIAQQIITARRVYRKYEKDAFWSPLNHPAVAAAFPMNSSRCWEYGGCEFIPMCTKQEGARDLYIVQEDNPELSHGKEESVTSEYGPTGGG